MEGRREYGISYLIYKTTNKSLLEHVKLAWESAYSKLQPSIQSSVNELGDLVCVCGGGGGGGNIDEYTIHLSLLLWQNTQYRML